MHTAVSAGQVALLVSTNFSTHVETQHSIKVVKKAEMQMMKQGLYLSFTTEERPQVAKYGSMARLFDNPTPQQIGTAGILALARQFFPNTDLPSVFINVVPSHTRLT